MPPLLRFQDPYMRGRMIQNRRSYIAPFKVRFTAQLFHFIFNSLITDDPNRKLGQPLAGYAVGRIIKSANPAFKEGAYVTGHLSWETYSVVRPDTQRGLAQVQVLVPTEGIPLSHYISVLGTLQHIKWPLVRCRDHCCRPK